MSRADSGAMMAAAALVLAGLARAWAPIAGAGAQVDRSRPIAPPPAPPRPPFDGLLAPQKHAPDPESGADGSVGPSVDGFRDGAVSPRRLDAGPSQLPPAPRPYPPTNRSRRLSQPGEGWYIGASGASCTETCTGNALLCTDQQMMAHNSEVNSDSEMMIKKAQLGFTGSSASSCTDGDRFAQEAPYFTSTECRYKNLNSKYQRDKYNCTASDAVKYRLCYCHPPLQAGWFIGKGGANCDDTCADAGLVCDVQDLEGKNSKTGSCSGFNTRLNGLGAGNPCTSGGNGNCQNHDSDSERAPRYGKCDGDDCDWKCQTTKSSKTYSCSAGAGGSDYHRLCYCVQPQPSPPPPSPPPFPPNSAPQPPPPSPPPPPRGARYYAMEFTDLRNNNKNWINVKQIAFEDNDGSRCHAFPRDRRASL